MAIHDEVLAAARRLCTAKGEWTFAPAEVVRALPHLNERSVRTHVVSRCCVNAPEHHAHRWPYFRRVGRGAYEVLPPFGGPGGVPLADRVAEPLASYAADRVEAVRAIARPAIHAVVVESEGAYVAECLEVAVVTQGQTLDELVANLRDAIDLHLDGEDNGRLGLSPSPRLVVSYETSAFAL